jgi:hypothetical protein
VNMLILNDPKSSTELFSMILTQVKLKFQYGTKEVEH